MTAAQQEAFEKVSQSVMALVTNLVLILDAKGEIIYASESVHQCLGYEVAALLGQPAADFLTFEQAAEVKSNLNAPPAPEWRQYQVRHQNGSWKSLAFTWTNLLGDPLVAGVLVVARDITDEVQIRRELAEQRKFYQTILEDLPYQVAVLDEQGRYVYTNPAATGNPEVRRGIIGLTDEEYCHWRGHDPQIAVNRQRHFDEASRSRRWVNWEEVMRDPDGHLRYHQRHYHPVFGSDGQLDRMIGYGRDDTERQRRLMMNARQTQALHLCAQGAPLQEVLDQILSALEASFPHSQAALCLGDEALPGPAAPGMTADILVGTARVGTLELHQPETGDLAEAQPVLDHLAGLASMVIERDLHLKQLERLAYADGLTNLMNRPAFVRALNQALASGQRPSVVILDLKQFRNVNSRYGHAAGDALLIAVARRIEHILPGCGVARVAGNGFALLIPGGPVESVITALPQVLSQPFAVRGETLYLNAHIGVSSEAQPQEDAEATVQEAEHALRQSKQLGQTISRYDAEEYAVELTAMTLEAELRQAFINRQLVLAFQPLVHARSGSLKAVEALLRWTHPQRGAISPQVFIALAEQSDLILDIGGWVLREACQQAAAWPGGPVQVSVNVSARQFESPRLKEDVLNALLVSGLPAHLLELELTENMLMTSGRDVVDVLEQLKALNVRLALDDFGTGYSSLAYLNRFPLDVLKIDRSFIQGLGLETYGQKNLAIVRSTIALAHELGIEVVAEGVETGLQREILVALGCDLLQGYFFSAPMPLEKAVTWRFGSGPRLTQP
ncbi:phosphodiesterase (plasmid) [Deinococcus psychrotolerans]|uniref:Phosphodiesterase n=1 Tax=Deinococcus psychrotolerans TaxID=2489213 RepID=A0A3G8YJZ7_9DEIO|nr:phosphodiesterase [Deinococcus psychrotolerans]